MLVRIHRNQLSYFRRKAKKNPNEIYALLFGRRVAPNLIEIYRFAYPKIKYATPTEVTPTAQSVTDLEDHAKEDGMSLVGSIHSHPGKDAAIYMSKTDFQSHRYNGDKVSGVCEVNENGRAYVAFWIDGSPLPCNTEYFDCYLATLEVTAQERQ